MRAGAGLRNAFLFLLLIIGLHVVIVKPDSIGRMQTQTQKRYGADATARRRAGAGASAPPTSTMLREIRRRQSQQQPSRDYMEAWPPGPDQVADSIPVGALQPAHQKPYTLENEERANAEFDKKLSQEERWIRQGIKARRTRNEGRVRALKSMREDYARRRNRQGTAGLEIQQGDNSGKVVIEAEHLRYAIDGLPLLRDFSITLLRGDRVGILGPNGCGKSTLIRLLLDRLTPDAGTVKHGTQLQVAYFDQMRDTLDSNKSVLDNLAEGSDVVEINGRKKHVMGYLQDFLFEPARARQPVRSLSGGERNRLLLAKLFTKPFNLLVLDEPTNDLDVETLRALEEALLTFPGCAIVISHDRWFLDRVATHILAFEGDAQVEWFEGSYTEFEEYRRKQLGDEALQPKRMKYKRIEV